MRRLVTLLLALLLMGVLAACGDDDSSDSSTSAEDPQTEADAPDRTETNADDDAAGGKDADAQDASGDVGTVTIDGTTYAMSTAMSCNPEGSPVDAELELAVLGSSASGFMQLDVHLFDIMGSAVQEVSWSGPEGTFSTSVSDSGSSWTSDSDEVYPDPPVSHDASRATGSLTIWDMDQATSVDIDFDIVIPSQQVACR